VRIAWLTLFAVALAAANAAAQPQPQAPSPEIRKQAEEQFQRGEAFFRAKRYDEAITAYREAYRLSALPALLLNIAQAYRLKGDARNAIANYRQFVEAAPDHEFAAEARVLIARLTAEVEETPPPGARAPPGGGAGARAPTRTVTVERAVPSRGSKSMRIAGLVTGGAGLVAIGFGIKYALEVRQLEDELSSRQGQWTEEELAKVDQGDRAETAEVLLLGLGGGAVVTGAVLYVIGRPSRESGPQAVGIAPVSHGSGLSIALSGHF
jgi:tetratricopeptide (TPR) repeat protein